MSKIIITGTPGSGKSVIISRLGNFKILNIGTEMMRYIKDKSISRDEIRSKLSYKEILEAREQVFKEISKIKGNVIIDTHTSVKNGKKFIPGFSSKDLSYLSDVSAIIYIDAPAVDILLRRIGDRTRTREDESADEIEEHRSVNIGLATYYSVQLGVPLYIIKNKQDRLEECRTEIEKAIADSIKGN